jgi:cobalt-zinc-cadmium resistance protein CzcA
MVKVLTDVPGAADVQAEQLSGLPFLNLIIDRDALSRYGIDAAQVVDIASTIAGRPVTEVFEGQLRYTLQVRLPPELRSLPESVRDIPVARPGGGTIPLGQLAKIEQVEGPATIGREAIERRMTIQVNVRDRDLAGFVDDARSRINRQVDLPPGYVTRWGGQFENLEKATARLSTAVPAALILIFLLLFMTYGAARPALIVYLNVPFAATGGVFALALRGMPFSISAGVGFIALFGIAVLNGVVLVSTIRDLQTTGIGLFDASEQAASVRLRPVLMTALTDALGFFPMAFSSGAGAEVQRPLATVVIGGLVTCTALTLFVLPSIYSRWGGKVADEESTSDSTLLPA